MAIDYSLSRRRLLKTLGAASLGLAAGGAGLATRVARAEAGSPITFGVGPMDRALNTLADNNYSIRAAGLAVTDSDSMLIDGTDRTRRVLYNYADRVGPYVDNLGDIAEARAAGRDYNVNGLIRAREDFHVFNTPIYQPQYYGVQQVWRASERFGFAVVPHPGAGPWYWGRPWPITGDFWGLIYVLDPQNTPFVWMVASTAEYRAIGPAGATRAVRTEVVVQRSGPGVWSEYRAEQAVISVPLRRGPTEFFSYPG